MQNRPYTIDVPKLKPGANHFRFQMDGAFFAQVEDTLIRQADVQVDARIDRQPALLDARLNLAGSIELICDRCLKPFSQPIDTQHRIVYSYETINEDAPQSEDEELVFIPRTLQTLDMSQDLYDLVSLQVPMRKVHPDHQLDVCLADETVRSLLLQPADDEMDDDNNNAADPRWDALNKLKDN